MFDDISIFHHVTTGEDKFSKLSVRIKGEPKKMSPMFGVDFLMFLCVFFREKNT